MFPFNESPISRLRTASDIEKFGKQALVRALNIGRVVAFVGSGTSIKHGQPSWKGFRGRAAKLFFELEKAIMDLDAWKLYETSQLKDDFRYELSPLIEEIKELHQSQGLEPGHFVELVEDYFSIVGDLLERHGILRDNSENVLKPDLNGERRKRVFLKCELASSRPSHFEDEDKWTKYYLGEALSEHDEIINIARDIGEFRREFAAQFKSTPHKKNDSAPYSLRHSEPFIDLITRFESRDTEPEGGADSSHYEERISKRFSEEIANFDAEREDVYCVDATRVLRLRLGMRRFLTLNYDLELELMLFEEGRATPPREFERFESFVLQSTQNGDGTRNREAGRAVTLTSPSGRVIRSTSSRKDTLADLFSFGAFPTNYDASVHHLHGRVDDPENMIITPKDYQHVYYGASEQKKSFDEARHAVFTGSDLFVLGMGTSEHDVLKPLRDFLELESDRRDALGKVYYVTASEFSGKQNSLYSAFIEVQRSAKAKTQQLYKDYGMHTLFIDLSFDRGRSRNWTDFNASLFAARAELHYHLHTISTTGNIRPWKESAIEADFNTIFGATYTAACPSGHGRGPHQSAIETPGNSRKFRPLQRTTFDELVLARELVSTWNLFPTPKKAKSRTDVEDILKRLDSHLRDKGLVEFGKQLETSRQEWWSDWSEIPGMRLAVLGPHRYEINWQSRNQKKTFNPEDIDFIIQDGGDSTPLVWRQTNLCCLFKKEHSKLGELDDTPQFTGLVIATAKAREEALHRACEQDPREQKVVEQQSDRLPQPTQTHEPIQYPATVARISIPPGGGKGRLVNFFTTPQRIRKHSDEQDYPFQTLFHGDFVKQSCISVNEPLSRPQYKACFAVHLTHTLEFSSCMIAFARLIQMTLPGLRAEAIEKAVPDSDDSRWDELLNHQFQARGDAKTCLSFIREVLDLLRRTCPHNGWEKNRIIAFFSYLDRLVDENGDAYSPVHREFFRLITGWNDEDAHVLLPFDLVLINSHANKPLRYLSLEQSLDKKMDGRRMSEWDDATWTLRHDRGVGLRNWHELPRVRPRIIFMEALEHAAALHRAEYGDTSDWVDGILDHIGGSGEDNDFLALSPGLKKFVHRRVANGHYIAGLAVSIWASAQTPGQPAGHAFLEEWHRCAMALDIAFSREKTRGLIDELLSIYRRLDRTTDSAPENRRPPSRMATSDATRREESLRTMVIDHLALMNFPVTAETLAACPDIQNSMRLQGDDMPIDKLVTVLDRIVARGLAARYERYVDRVRGEGGAQAPDTRYVYALDTKVAAVLRARANLEVYSQYRLVTFQPSVYPSQPERALKPDMVHFERVSGIIRALVKTTHQTLVDMYWKRQHPDYVWPNSEHERAKFAYEMEAYIDKLRAAYALVRGTFSISVIARLAESTPRDARIKPYDEYRTWTRKLLNTATLMGKIRGLYFQAMRPFSSDPIPFNHPFLRDEISWLYNERALVSFVQGRLFDALPLFEQAQVMLGRAARRSVPPSEDATHRRVQLNFSLAQIERGNIVIAQDTLSKIVRDTAQRWPSDTPSVVHTIAKGYVALCHHLTNEFARAQDGYESVIEEIGQFNHPRAESIFRRHFADLLRTMAKSRNDQEYTAAIAHLRSSEELALGIRATDLYNYALMAQARLHRDMHNRGQALENLRQVEEFARSMGIQKILCEVLKVRGEVLLADGETTQAGFVTSQSIAISKRNGMRLRKISAAIIQAKILHRRGQKKDSARLLEETITESKTLGYATKTSQAMGLLRL